LDRFFDHTVTKLCHGPKLNVMQRP
jgi:hypothetical protein